MRPGYLTADLYVVGGQSQGFATWGESIGSTHNIAACTVTSTGTTCDPATPVTVMNCGQPTTCDSTNCGGVQSDGCGGTIDCGTTCAKGSTCHSGMCEAPATCHTPMTCCIQAGGNWIGGKCQIL